MTIKTYSTCNHTIKKTQASIKMIKAWFLKRIPLLLKGFFLDVTAVTFLPIFEVFLD